LGIPDEAAQNALAEIDSVWGFAFGLAGEDVTFYQPRKC